MAWLEHCVCPTTSPVQAWERNFDLAICSKAFWPPKSPETTPNPKFSRKSAVAPKSPRNSHWMHTKRHTKPHRIPLIFPTFPEFSRICPNSTESLKFPGNQGGERNSRNQPLGYGLVAYGMANFQSPKHIFQRPKFPGKSLKFRSGSHFGLIYPKILGRGGLEARGRYVERRTVGNTNKNDAGKAY